MDKQRNGIPPKFAEDSLDTMFAMLMMGKQKSNIPVLKEHLDKLRRLLTQKTAGQQPYAKSSDVDFAEIWTVCNVIVIETMCLYLSGDLDRIEEAADGTEELTDE